MMSGPSTLAEILEALPSDLREPAGLVATAILLNGPAEASTLGAAVHAVLSGRLRLADGSDPSQQDCEHLLWEWIRPGNSLGFIDYRMGGREGKTFSTTGRTAAMAGLVQRSNAPRVNVS